jgi:lysophospholipase L1-like esterase
MQYPLSRLAAVFALALSFQAMDAAAAGGAVVDARWEPSLAEFDAADKLHAPAVGGVVFVGSSSIRLWPDLEKQFGDVPVIKRGFGGSRLADCAVHADRLVTRYKPRQVIVYAGDNDLAEGHKPAEVLASYEAFVSRVREAVPGVRIAYVSIKPSPLRANLMAAARETNAHNRQFTEAHPQALEYIDIFTPMLGQDGTVRADLYGPDSLHMNAAGYALWRERISPRIR